MQALQALQGFYNSVEETYHLSIDKSENISRKQIEDICIQIIKQKIQNFTLEFDDGNFIFFTNLKEKIHFVEGPQAEYVRLQQRAKDDLNGEIVEHNSLKYDVPLLKPSLITSETDADASFMDEKALIQNSLFSPMERFKKVFADAQIYFKPFEDTGGDFYWIKEYQNHSLVVVGDCTGHGLQGAMICMSVMTILKQFFKKPPESLENSIYEFYAQFKSLLEEESSDFFDTELGFILLEHQSNKISYTGSGINLIVKTTTSTNIYRSRKSKIENRTQKSLEFSLTRGDQLFLFSDGIPDQFDSFDKKKLGAKGLLKLLSQKEQVTLTSFTDAFNVFKGTTKPLDDQTLLILTI